MTYPDAIIDKRVVNRYIEKGLVEAAVLEKHIKTLPDSQANAVQVEAEQRPDEHDQDGSVQSIE
jgi:hypothetical protein